MVLNTNERILGIFFCGRVQTREIGRNFHLTNAIIALLASDAVLKGKDNGFWTQSSNQVRPLF